MTNDHTVVGGFAPLLRSLAGISIRVLAFVAAVLLVGYLGVKRSASFILAPAAARVVDSVEQPASAFDPAKPTVAILHGNTVTEATDFLGPYAMFAEAGAYNVYAVASSRAPRAITGGLDVAPQLSFAELGKRVTRGPAVVVVPAMANVESPDNVALIDWVRSRGQGTAFVFAWCEGAQVLAAAGLLDGQKATTHWGAIDGFEQTYPSTKWTRGERFIDGDTVMTTAGLTSGIDATLHFLDTRNGRAVAEKVAGGLDLQWSPYVSATRMPHYSREWSDSVLLINMGFRWPRPRLGLQLSDGASELGVAAVIDAYQATDRIVTMADTDAVFSRHGLELLPRWTTRNAPKVDRTLSPNEVTFESALQDLAGRYDRATATFAAKRLEVRVPLTQSGRSWPWAPVLTMMLSGLSGLVVLGFLKRQR